MFKDIFKPKINQPIDRMINVYDPYLPKRSELREIEKCFARLFISDDGRRALSYLQEVTFQRALGSSSSNEDLRYAEGQRFLVATILRLIDRGRQNQS